MWGEIGFLSAAAIFAFVAFLSLNLKIDDNRFSVILYGVAHIVASLAFLLWGLVLYGSVSLTLKNAVLIGDMLLIGSSILMATSSFQKKSRAKVLIGSSVLGVLFLITRYAIIKPEPYIDNHILVFNSQVLVSIALVLIFALAWFRTNIVLGTTIIKNSRELQDLWTAWYFVNLLAFIGFCGFIVGKKPQTVALSFVALVTSYLVLGCFIYGAQRVAINGK